jgi:hypothetical protein
VRRHWPDITRTPKNEVFPASGQVFQFVQAQSSFFGMASEGNLDRPKRTAGKLSEALRLAEMDGQSFARWCHTCAQIIGCAAAHRDTRTLPSPPTQRTTQAPDPKTFFHTSHKNYDLLFRAANL